MRAIPHSDLALLSKKELHSLADGLIGGYQDSIDHCVEFVANESKGIWHGRGRAMMCRRLKHCALTAAQKTQLLEAILERFVGGGFSEQFKDQLRLAMHLNWEVTLAAAHKALKSHKNHVVRYAQWVLPHEVLNAPSAIANPGCARTTP